MEMYRGAPFTAIPDRVTAGTALRRGIHITDLFWLYTLAALFFKSIVLLGLTMDQLHTTILFNNAMNAANRNFPFYLGSVALLPAFAFLFKKKGRMWYLLILNLLVSILFCADLWYFRAFNTMPTMNILRETSNLNNLSGSIIGMMRPVDLAFVCDFILLVPFAVFAGKAYKSARRRIVTFILILAAAAGLLSYTPLKLYMSGMSSARVKNSIIYMYDSTVTSRNLSPLGYQLYSVYNFFNEGKTIKLSAGQKNEISQWYAANKETLPDNSYKGMFAGKNLLVIEVESLEKFVVNQKINGQEITPNINRLLKNSIYFTDVHEQVHEGNTIDAEFIANTSLYPLLQGSTSFLYPYNDYENTLPKIMGRNGYHTTDIQPDPGSFWNWMILMKSLGFEKCIDNSAFKTDQSFGMGISDESFLKQVEPLIVNQKQPFYTFMITQSTHTPYDLPYGLRELKLPGTLDNTYLGGYLQSIHYTDKYLGQFLDGLEKDGVLDNTVVVMYGDHEGIHKYFPDSLKDITGLEGEWWKDNKKQTPLIVYKPGMKPEEIATTGGEIDILPTVCNLMGIDSSEYEGTAMGRNLLNTDRSFAVLQGGEYVGPAGDTEQAARATKGLDVADTIIRSNYFNK
ncbi:MAG TPA: LTA synthase family protein [Clostridia bacterium]|nr:LTA synthase family protein [Clostridia bacterium]